ncbi:MAG: hypothetical protein Q8S26_19040 [Azonexus sp.]|nr:hypothetical protein [Azonexus sp.]
MPKPAHSLHNPEAGNHPLPEDPREIKAVLRATKRCYRRHPYFARRYEQRGAAFARSDAGYLATLTTHPQSHVDDQVAWLAGVLACRGMPRWLMEEHLELLFEELSQAVPARADDFQKLRSAAAVLRAERQAWIRQADFEILSANFASTAGPSLKNAGGLLVAAVCDECCGLPHSVSSLTLWLSNPERFPVKWCSAVSETLAQARALVATKKRTHP